jgi:hypothetical protein
MTLLDMHCISGLKFLVDKSSPNIVDAFSRGYFPAQGNISRLKGIFPGMPRRSQPQKGYISSPATVRGNNKDNPKEVTKWEEW